MPHHATSPRIAAALTARDVAYSYGGRRVLDHVSISIAPGEVVGVLGPNGAGKSTLLRLLAGRLQPEHGTVRADPPTAAIGLLDQEHVAAPGQLVGELLCERTGVTQAHRDLERAGAGLAAGTPGAADAFAVALERFDALGAGDADARIAGVLDELGVGAHRVDQEVATLSGGQLAKVALASIELSRYSLVLLDEPTNNLDFEGLERLERWMTTRAEAVVVVSHDRLLLERTVSAIADLDPWTGTLRRFGGGWQSFVEERARARRHAEEAYASYVHERDELQGRMRRQRDWAIQGVAKERRDMPDNDKAQRDFRINRTEKQASKVRQSERALERLEEVDKPHEPWQLKFVIEQTGRSGDVAAALADAVVVRGDFTLGPVTLELGWADRLGVLGGNGSGKTTLVEALLGVRPLERGTSMLGPSVRAGVLGQERWAVASDADLVRVVMDRCSLRLPEARSLLAKFGLGADHVSRHPSTLSPGERTRAELAVFQAKGVNLLVLDEPTNHLDLPAIEQLESALEAFAGTLVLVTHDRSLLEAVRLTRMVEVEAGSVRSTALPTLGGAAR